MTLSDAFALFALIISFGSFYISKRSLDFAIEMQKVAERKLIENEKAELLKQISNNKFVLNNARIEIGSLQAEFAAEPEHVKKLMENYTDIFFEFLPSIERMISRLESDYLNLVNWPGEISHSDILRTKSVFYEDLKAFETAHEQAVKCVAIFKEKLSLAKSYVQYT